MTDPSPKSPPPSFARALRNAAVILGLILGALALWIWASSGNNVNLPFEYGGFD